MKLEAEVWVDAKPEVVWAVMLDLEKAQRFVPLLLSVEPLSQAPDVGAVVRMTFGRGDRRLTTDATVTEFEPLRRLALRANVEEVDATIDIHWLAEAKDEGTLVHQSVSARFHSMIARIGARALFGQAETQQRDALQRFKEVAESEAADAASSNNPPSETVSADSASAGSEETERSGEPGAE